MSFGSHSTRASRGVCTLDTNSDTVPEASCARRLLRATCWASEDRTVSWGGVGARSRCPLREVKDEPTHPPKREYRDAAEPAHVPRTGAPGGIICTGHTQCESRAVVAEARLCCVCVWARGQSSRYSLRHSMSK